jgi:hypothetical protein
MKSKISVRFSARLSLPLKKDVKKGRNDDKDEGKKILIHVCRRRLAEDRSCSYSERKIFVCFLTDWNDIGNGRERIWGDYIAMGGGTTHLVSAENQ